MHSRSVYVVIAFIVMLFTNIGVTGSLLILYVRDMYKLEAITPIAGSFTVSAMISVISMTFAGYVYDRRGPRVLLLLAALCSLSWGLSIYYMKGSNSWNQAVFPWYIAWAFNGFSFPLIVMSINPVLMTMFPSRRGLAISISQTAQALSMALWPYVLKHMFSEIGFFDALLTISVFNALILLIAMTLWSGVRNDAKSDRLGKQLVSIRSYRHIATGLLPVFSMIFSIAMSSVMVMSFFAGILEDSFQSLGGNTADVNEALIPFIMSLTGLIQALMAVPWGFIIDKIGPLRIIPVIYLAEAIATSLALTTYAMDPWITSIALIIRYMFFSGEPIVHWALIPLLFGTENLGLVSGALNTAPIATSIITPILGGLIKDITGSYKALLAISTALSLLAFSIYMSKLRSFSSGKDSASKYLNQ